MAGSHIILASKQENLSLGFVNNKRVDQSDHQFRLINAFINHSSDRNLSKLVRDEIQIF